MIRNILSIATMIGAASMLTACELRRDGVEEGTEVEGAESADPSATATPEPSDTAVASIIREDLPSSQETEVPTQPVELTIPFPESAALSTRAERMLAGVMAEDALDEDWPIVIAGHTDSSGNDQANLRASRSRAEAVAAWLVERGVDDDRIEVIAFGEQNPVAPNALPNGEPNEEGRRQNRRVELRIAPPQSDAGDETEETPENDEDA